MTDPDASTLSEIATAFVAVRTARLILRRPREDDGSAMFAVHGDPATNLHNPAGPDLDLATSEETLRGWLRRWNDDGFGYWTVLLPGVLGAGEKIVGFGGVTRLAWREREALNLYYRLTPSAWGQGYAGELARTAVDLARAYLPHLPVIARMRASNTASQRTAARAGLERRPDLETEHMVFALGWPPDDE